MFARDDKSGPKCGTSAASDPLRIKKRGLMFEQGTYVIVRAYQAGVVAGEFQSIDGSQVVLKNARRIYYWDGAATLHGLAIYGPSKPQNCKFPGKVDKVAILDACEVIECSAKGRKAIEAVPEWKQ
jgi:hypothetical protein